ncbi:putative receptor-like protein kinase [Citrus sinensis]|uniref:Receptor-like protein kinase n=1 Tax=Citrus sinensis TaxID=2711 RepID=A0ACB8JHV9_CITSI|nr:putative receptor-like protein kinase [Citrus sinensis]
MKSQLQDPLGVTSSWNNSINLCQWTGVTCGHRRQRVTGLDLRQQSVGGVLSPFVGNLSFPRSINLPNKSFRGEIPHEFEASNNKLEAEIPVEIGNLLMLQILNIAENHLKGQLPASIGNLSALQEIDVRGNRLGGRIPSTISHVRNLISFNVARNQFSDSMEVYPLIMESIFQT